MNKHPMTTYKFKTNIQCGNCLNAVSPFLNKDLDILYWEVDITDSEKVLRVEGEVSPERVRELIAEAGFEAELLTSEQDVQ